MHVLRCLVKVLSANGEQQKLTLVKKVHEDKLDIHLQSFSDAGLR